MNSTPDRPTGTPDAGPAAGIRGPRLRFATAVVAACGPAPLRRWMLRRLLGYDIAADAVVGHSVVAVDSLVMRSGASIGSLCLLRRCERVELGRGASIGFLVWVNGVARSRGYFSGQTRDLALVLGDGAAITCLHVIDCCDRVDVGAFSTIAGFGSQILTHSIDIGAGRQVARPVRIGERVFVGTRATLLPGSVVPSRSVVAAGAVVTSRFSDELTLYAGTPAAARRSLDPDSGYFTRREGRVR
jgi:acetyltransferase-like isoleucine patch superfamily enzyme